MERLAVQVITAVGERDAAVAATEARAGETLSRMVEVEVASVAGAGAGAGAVASCAAAVTVREVDRLRRLADPPDNQPPDDRPPPG